MAGRLVKILSFLREDSPYSTMRVSTFLTIALFVPCFVYQWAAISASQHALQPIPDGVMWLLGVLLGGKAVQKGIEVAGNIFGKDAAK